MPSHPNITSSWIEWEVEDGIPRPILILATDFELDPGSNDFDSSKLNDLVQSAVRENAAIGAHRIRIVRVERRPA